MGYRESVMRYARLRDPEGGASFAELEGEVAHVLDSAPWLGGRRSGRSTAWTEGDLLCPVTPSKIVCIGRNYAAHARELGHEIPPEPLLFLKAPSALAGPGDAIVLPPESQRVEHEAELAVVIGSRTKGVSRDSALRHVLGVTCACDVTARDLQKKDVQFTRSKSFDTFCPIGPWIETDVDVTTTPVRCRVNGAIRQDGNTANMLFDVATLVTFVSRMMTLEPGDTILTGTPEGVGPLAPGDALEVEVGGVGTLRMRIESRTPARAHPA
jgi:2-keto-4-pentenoate hydratase/2-oxohepta-3-ene-1,7-dioic acid hydratase in catechol pathway